MGILTVNNVVKRFGGLAAVDHVSLEVEEGEILGLIGPNGAGKTTLFNCIAGYYPVTEGQVLFEGKDITRHAAHQTCKMGIARTFQIVRALPHLTVLENVMVGAFLRTASLSRARQEALSVLESVHMRGKEHVLASGLTLADKKRLEIARAIATKPRLLMLDEVMAGLTPTERQEGVKLIADLHSAGGLTIIVVEHIMEVVMTLSHRVVVLNYGKLIADGTPEEVSRNANVIEAYLGRRYRQAAGEGS